MLHITVCPDIDRAIQRLADHMPAGRADGVLQPWHVVVAGSSAQRVVSQRLSHVLGASQPGVASGVSANIHLELPGWLNDLIRPIPRTDDQWAVARMAWKLMALPAEPGVRRWRSARRIADDLDRTQMWRPDVVLDWMQRPALAPDARPPLSTDLAEMMAYLRGQHDQPTMVEQAAQVIAAIHAGEPGLDSAKVHDGRPLMLFGVNNLPVLQLSVIAAYALTHDVYWWVTTPMMAIAKEILGDLPDPETVRRDPSGVFLVRDDRSTLDLARHAHTGFTRANGRETIEGLRGVASVAALAGARITIDEPTPTRPVGEPSALAMVQMGIRTDTDLPAVPDSWQEPGPGASLVRVACARPHRQVEALRDYLVHRFLDDDTLQPRDVIVACPDPHAWEASIRRAFAPGAGRPNLRVRLIDPYARIPNPVRDVVERILSLVNGQLTRIQVMELAAMAPVAAKFGFDEQAITDLTAYLEATHMTWGLDPEDRTRFRLPAFHGGTLQDSLDQLALGLTRFDGGLDDLPAVGVKAGHGEMIGQFFAFATALREAITRARTAMAVTEGWVPLMTWMVETFCWVDFDHGWQVTSMIRELNRLAEMASDGPNDVTSQEFSEILAQMHMAGGRRGDIGAGDLVVTSLANARGLHHRVVCLLGMDEGRVPRPRTRVGIAEWGAERIGDRDAAANDRQAWLDLLAGRAHHIAIFWSAPPQGGDAHPSVMVNDLNRIVADAGLDSHDDLKIREGALHRWSVVDHLDHPSSDRRGAELAEINYNSSATSLDRDHLEDLKVDPVPWPEAFTLTDLERFGVDPLQAYAQHTLGIGWLGTQDEPDDVVVATTSGGLAGWAVNDQALRSSLPEHTIVDRAIRSGRLPTRPLTKGVEDTVSELRDQVDHILTGHGVDATQPVITRVMLEIPTQGGRVLRIVDRVRVDRRPDGTYALVTVTASGYKRRTMWRLWLRVLALMQTYPATGVDVVYGCKLPRIGYQGLGFTPITPDQAAEYLHRIANTVELGLSTPLIAPISTAMAWATRRSSTPSAIRSAWEGSAFSFDQAEAAAGSVIRLIGGNLPAEWVLDQQVHEERHVDVIANGLWQPFLAHLDGPNPDKKRR